MDTIVACLPLLFSFAYLQHRKPICKLSTGKDILQKMSNLWSSLFLSALNSIQSAISNENYIYFLIHLKYIKIYFIIYLSEVSSKCYSWQLILNIIFHNKTPSKILALLLRAFTWRAFVPKSINISKAGFTFSPAQQIVVSLKSRCFRIC